MVFYGEYLLSGYYGTSFLLGLVQFIVVMFTLNWQK